MRIRWDSNIVNIQIVWQITLMLLAVGAVVVCVVNFARNTLIQVRGGWYSYLSGFRFLLIGLLVMIGILN